MSATGPDTPSGLQFRTEALLGRSELDRSALLVYGREGTTSVRAWVGQSAIGR